MMDATPGAVENNAETTLETVETSGESFPDGSAIELISSSRGNKPNLLFWAAGRDPMLSTQIQREGKLYIPINADPTIWAATTLPTGAVDRGPSARLFSETSELIENCVGVSADEAALATSWNATTWFADVIPNPPTLFIHGTDMNLAMIFLWLLGCITRHALIVTEMSRAAFYSLMAVRPTLLLNQPQISSRFRALCCNSNYRGLVLPGRNGGVVDVVSAKAIFSGSTARARSDGGIHLYLPAAPRNLHPLDEAAQLGIKKRFQPWYLWHRLSNLPEVRQARFGGGGLASTAHAVGHVLQSCTTKGSPLKLQWAPLLRRQEQDARAERYWDPLSALLEVLWPRLHSYETSVTMKELTGLANTLLRSRGETREYSSEELGIKLANEGVSRRRRSSGMIVLFDRATKRRLHELARSLDVGKNVSECPGCTAKETAAG